MDDDRTAALARALSHPARIRIVCMLAAQAECSGAEIFSGVPLAQSTISEHLRVLKDAGIVHARPVGASMVYCVDSAPLLELTTAIGSIAASAPACSPTPNSEACS